MASSPVVIRKYENRRLYDTAASRYINLEDVADMVRHGIEVQVLDAKTGEDITRVILTQIIVEDAKARDTGLPLDFLRQLVVASGRAGQENFARYMKTMFETYEKAYETFQTRLRETAPLALSPVDLMQAFFNPRSNSPVSPWSYRPTAEPPAPDTPAETVAPHNNHEHDMEELRKRIEELERRLAEASAAKPRRRR